MAWKKGNPGCGCCVCQIDALSAETAFTEDVIRSAEHPQSPYPTWLQAEVKAAVGDTLKLFLAWDDDTPGDGLYIEFTPENVPSLATIKIFRKGGSQIGDTLNVGCGEADTWHRLTVCYDPDYRRVTVCFDVGDFSGTDYTSRCDNEDVPVDFVAGRKAGYGGTGSIKNYKYDRLWYCGVPPFTAACLELGS